MLVKHPRDAFVDDATIDEQWKPLNFADAPSLPTAIEEYEALLARPNIKEFTPTKAELKALRAAERNFKKGKTQSYDEFVRRVDSPH